MFPIMLAHRTAYLIGTDEYVRGWWAFMLRFKKEPQRLSISWGWTPVGGNHG